MATATQLPQIVASFVGGPQRMLIGGECVESASAYLETKSVWIGLRS